MNSTPSSALPGAPQEPPRLTSWQLTKPYWVTPGERLKAWGLLITILVMNFVMVWISVRLNSWSSDFYNALQSKDVTHFPHLLTVFAVLAFANIVIAVYRSYLRQMLSFGWRQWLTTRYLQDWLGGGTFYRVERDGLADNPDQRIADDLQSFANTTLALTLDLISTVVTLVSFITILWSLAGAASLVLFGQTFTIPGYMVLAAAIYAVAGSLMTHWMGRRLVPINYQMQLVEADFRFGLIRMRENAEQIAFYGGMGVEQERAHGLFARIRANWYDFMRYTKRMNFALNFYAQIAIIFPIVVAAPRYFAGAYSFGVLMRISDAFGTVSGAFSWFINSYGTLVSWRATVNRLVEFDRVMRIARAQATQAAGGRHGIRLDDSDANRLTMRGLRLARPDGTPLADLGDLSFEPGSRWLVRGPSGVGKSTLLRALAGLWPFGSGEIARPAGARMMFVPQRGYLPIGTLKAALTYPAAPDAFDDAACRDALRACGLEAYAERLGESAHWQHTLSPGEQQRLTGARVLLHKPDYLFLDEATSALDEDNQAQLYRLFHTRLPHAAIVSIAHRDSLAAFHTQTLEILPSARPEISEAATPAIQ